MELWNVNIVFFFFSSRRRHTRCGRDWSSDVCSSDLCMIGATIFMTPYFDQPILALAWGVFIAGVVQLLFQLPFLAQIRLLPIPRPDRKHEGVRRIMTLMIPALFGVSVSQINLLLDTVLASFLQTGRDRKST